MTLIITAANGSNIWQSADYRLTDATTRRVLTDQSTKLIWLDWFNWTGSISYTGIGAWDNRDTSHWVTTWLDGAVSATPDAIDKLVWEKGTAWLNTIARRLSYTPHHTFVFAAFDDQGSRISIISNFENGRGSTASVARPELTVTTLRPRANPAVFVCGAAPAVDALERKRLVRLMRDRTLDTARMRRALSAVNQKAAASPASRGTVSPECTAIWSRRDGRGAAEVGGRVHMRTVTNGMVMPDLLDLPGLENARVVSATMGSSRSGPATAPCTPVQTGLSDRYSITELTHPDFVSLTTRDVNRAGVVVGSGLRSDHPTDIPWRATPEGVVQPAEFAGVAEGVDDAGRATGHGVDDQGRQTAMVWDGATVDERSSGPGRDSSAMVASSAGVAAGFIGLPLENRGQMAWRPAVWLDGGPPTVMDPVPGDWGFCRDVHDDGTALLAIYTAGRPRILLWNARSGVWNEVWQGRPAIPVGMTRAGMVVGMAEEVCLVGRPDESPREVFDRPGFIATAVAEDGVIAGHTRQGGHGTPWVRLGEGELVHLPCYRDHWTTPTAINADGWIVGNATSDHGVHALLWKPTGTPAAAARFP